MTSSQANSDGGDLQRGVSDYHIDAESESRIETMRKLLEERAAKKAHARAEADAARKARDDEYREQLAKGNSNSGGGAKRTPRRSRPFRFR